MKNTLIKSIRAQKEAQENQVDFKRGTTRKLADGSWEGIVYDKKDNTICHTYGESKQEAEENTERIVKGLNIFSAMENYLKTKGYKINKEQDIKIEFIAELLKQAEEKQK